jgi:hypothetical protein
MTADRYISFGEQVGAVTRLTLEPDQVPARLRNSIWNCAGPLFGRDDLGRLPAVGPQSFWLRMARDKGCLQDEHRYSNPGVCTVLIRAWLLDRAKWHDVYEFVQSFSRWAEFDADTSDGWERLADDILYEELSVYRFVAHKLSPIASDAERAEVAEAVAHAGKYGLAAEHMGKALTKFSARPNPDYENAAKEAASAVEGALIIANGRQQDFGDAVRAFSTTYSVHLALMETANKLFGYASDRDGVRHAKTAPGDAVDFNEAKLVLVSASAWLNFIAAKAPSVRKPYGWHGVCRCVCRRPTIRENPIQQAIIKCFLQVRSLMLYPTELRAHLEN